MTEIEPVLSSLDTNEPLYTAFDEIELTRMAVTDADLQAMRVTEEDLECMALDIKDVLAMTDADWIRLRLTRDALIQVRDDLIRRLGLSAQDLPWLSHAIERRQHGYTRAQTGAD